MAVLALKASTAGVPLTGDALENSCLYHAYLPHGSTHTTLFFQLSMWVGLMSATPS